MTHTPRIRWGIEHDFAFGRSKTRRPNWHLLAAGWHPSRVEIPAHVDVWPMSVRTRQEARALVQQMTAAAAQYSQGWRFRARRLEITVVSR